MKIISWNVNGIRACARKGFLDWLGACDAEIVGLQEVRARVEQIDEDVLSPEGWHVDIVHAERKGYSGVGMYARLKPEEIDTSLGVEEFDAEGRVQLAYFGDLLVANVYFPNGSGKNRDNSRIPFKLAFYEKLYDVLEAGKKRGEPILVIGDFNTAHEEIDLARPKQNVKTSGFRPEEREELGRWLDNGWTDTFRHFHPDTTDAYTWWSQRFGIREKNIGWRIDYILASPGAMKHVEGAEIHPHDLGSDHCPISVEVNKKILG